MSYEQLPMPVPGAAIPGVGQFYGALTVDKPQRRRLNIVAVCEMIFVPWILFTSIYSLLSFQFHHQHPDLTFLFCLLCLAGVLAVGWQALRNTEMKLRGAPVEPTWLYFLFAACLFGWCLAMFLGELNFARNGSVYYSSKTLNTYNAVNPAQMNGMQLMDAGRVHFADGAKIDITKSLGFKNHDQYCVAPIVLGDANLTTYDFWAVGTNCCSGRAPDYHCGEFQNPKARAGMRVVNDEQRPFFRLAVEQAEGYHKIKANHPLFFYWMEDPTSSINWYRDASFRCYILGMFGYFAFNLCCVLVTTVAYTKFGNS